MTDLELKYKFFGLHLGQALKVPCMDTPILAGLANTSIIGYPEAICKTVEGNRTSFDSVSIEHCQLILKPLSDIKDEEIKTICRLAFDNHILKIIREPLQIRVKFKALMLQLVIRFSGNVHGEFFDDSDALGADLEIYDTLRSMGYALPYMGKDPFKEGFAIRA